MVVPCFPGGRDMIAQGLVEEAKIARRFLEQLLMLSPWVFQVSVSSLGSIAFVLTLLGRSAVEGAEGKFKLTLLI